MSLEWALYSLIVILGQEPSSPSGQTKSLDIVLATRLPKNWIKMVILIVHMGKFSPSNLGGQQILDFPLYAMSVQNKYSN